MAVSVTSIANMALAHLSGNARITDFDTATSNEGYYCRLFYEQARDSVLQDFDWKFASVYVTLADIGNPPADWTYRYAYPAQCLQIRAIPQATNPRLSEDFDTVGLYDTTSGYTGRAIVSNTENAVARFTARVTNPEQFSAGFVTALSWRLAMDLEQPITGRSSELPTQMYVAMLQSAQANNANETHNDFNREADWITARA